MSGRRALGSKIIDRRNDATSEQMRVIADLAERYSQNELRVTHEQNVVLPHVAICDLYKVYRGLAAIGLDAPNKGLVTDIIAAIGFVMKVDVGEEGAYFLGNRRVRAARPDRSSEEGLRIGWPDNFIEHASSVEALRERYGLTEPQIEERVRRRLSEESQLVSLADENSGAEAAG